MNRQSFKRRSDRIWITVFLLPVGLMIIAFFAYPIIFLILLGFMEWNGIQPMSFVGLDNFRAIFSNAVFRTSVQNNLVWALSAAFLQIPLALVLALILTRAPRGWRFFRTVYFLPNVISLVALAMMWSALYNPEFGLINHALEALGAGHLARNWLGEIDTALPALIFSYQIYVGYFMVIILAGTLSIPQEFYEAALMDGANLLQQEIYITLPAIRGIIVTAGTLAVAFALRQFETTFLMTAGGPANRTPVMGLFMYRRMAGLQYGRAAATGVLLIILGVVVLAGLQRIFGKSDAVADSNQ
ncbi:carbohydrate ABC transporter permease [Alkalispirochaeta americana]|uniref:carbohydrate ABC transporter permease n=1 Tax=Alkalispirochaeta americana TaxID=159291 RepID=UPI0009711F9E|nr:sugar ABC transporter permease [Alkalispirochaeta americana]